MGKEGNITTGAVILNIAQRSPWTTGKLLFFLVRGLQFKEITEALTLRKQNRYYPLSTVV